MKTTLSRWAAAALAALAPAAWAADAAYDFVACTHTKRTMLEANADVVAFGVESWGIVATTTTKEWEGATTHCVGYMRVMAGKPVGKGVCKWVFGAGDSAVGEFEVPATGENRFSWLAGTGKMKGIVGGGTFQFVAAGKPIEPGTVQDCRRDWGRYTMP